MAIINMIPGSSRMGAGSRGKRIRRARLNMEIGCEYSKWFNYKYSISDTICGSILRLSGLLLALSPLIAPAFERELRIIRIRRITMLAPARFMILTPLSPNYQTFAGF